MYEDAGISGAKVDEDDMSIDRPGLQDMLADLNEDIKYIVVLTTSRLWRADMVKAIIQRDLRKMGADVRAVDRPNYSIYERDPTSVLINGMMELLDLYERLEIAKRLRRGRRAKAANGGYAGGNAPVGYRRERHAGGISTQASMHMTASPVITVSMRLLMAWRNWCRVS